LAAELTAMGHSVSASKVGQLLREQGYSLQGNSRVKEGKQHPDRDGQFAFINARSKAFLAEGVPVISVDSKKKELVGEYANRGHEWQPKGKAVEVLTYDFPDPQQSKAIPYGIFDVAGNEGFVNVGTDHDTPHFAVRSIHRWWELMGSRRYVDAKEIFITADCGGSNSSRSTVWKAELQKFSDQYGLTVHVSHFPPGTSKWNRIEHRLFSFISLNWRGRPLTTYETVVALIGGTRTATGLKVKAELDTQKYPLGRTASKERAELALFGDPFQPTWNYTLRPRSPEFIEETQNPKRATPPLQTVLRANLLWAPIFKEYRTSGLRPIEFCRRRSINYNSFTRWRIRFEGVLRQHSPHPKQIVWQNHIRQYQESGVSPNDYCQAHGLNRRTFDRWKQLLSRPNPVK
jgi:hypothetical protein